MELCFGSSDGKLLSSSQWGARYLPPACKPSGFPHPSQREAVGGSALVAQELEEPEP